MVNPQIELGQQLVSKLERLSADSYWAHQASGIRGSLIRCLSELEEIKEPSIDNIHRLEGLIDFGFILLVKAAKEYS